MTQEGQSARKKEKAKMKVLDLFCGRGGWSRPFVEDGDEVYGVDIKDFSGIYQGHFIHQDIRDFNPAVGYDLVIGSPPCDEFSKVGAKGRRHEPNIEKGLEFVREFIRLKDAIAPPLWAFENVTRLQKFYPVKPILTFRMGAQARRGLWGNIPFGMVPDFRFPNRILASRMGRYYAKRKGIKPLNGQEFAEIPYPVARFVADQVKRSLQEIPA